MSCDKTTKCATCMHWLGDCTLGAPTPKPVKPVVMPLVRWCGGYHASQATRLADIYMGVDLQSE